MVALKEETLIHNDIERILKKKINKHQVFLRTCNGKLNERTITKSQGQIRYKTSKKLQLGDTWYL